ncbi:Glycosyltransferase involved in cell wall bisynthesis [Parapedobacter composti]|uniref:Glycosyltransferase involved in cell wall bisynthesis n=1 Tax=Parapedobacter composti TaxID=623281 RepID=A0A1I1DV71_9SPHI|nr:glycosyltransferase [Parapedobacter composti]SFB78302.1 Glycosyltransferase involved in cell wall bisynthesis [Parapedobacter composti]
MITTPLVSIVIPCYNCASTIIEAVESARNQSYGYIEIIVVDDGSTDSSFHTINMYVSEQANIKIIQQENSGPAKARNTGFMHAKGQFLLFLDGDDKLHPDFVQECLAAYINAPDLQIVYTRARFFGSTRGEWKIKPFEQDTLLFKNAIPIFAMIRASTFKAVGMFDENMRLAEDWELWIRIVDKYGPKVHRIDRELYYYRKSGTGQSLTDLRYSSNAWDDAVIYMYQKHYPLYKASRGSIYDLFEAKKYKDDYEQKWYRKLFYRIFKPTKYKRKYQR